MKYAKQITIASEEYVGYETRLVEGILADGSSIYDVQVLVDGGPVITLGADSERHAIDVYESVSGVMEVSVDVRPVTIDMGRR